MAEKNLADSIEMAAEWLDDSAVKAAFFDVFDHYGLSLRNVAQEMNVSASTLTRRLKNACLLTRGDAAGALNILGAVASASANPARSTDEVAQRLIKALEDKNVMELPPMTGKELTVMRISQALDALSDSDLALIEQLVNRLTGQQ